MGGKAASATARTVQMLPRWAAKPRMKAKKKARTNATICRVTLQSLRCLEAIHVKGAFRPAPSSGGGITRVCTQTDFSSRGWRRDLMLG
jgi:hypothetical protein